MRPMNHDIVVVSVAPAELETEKAVFGQRVPLQRRGRVEEIASAYLHLMTNGFITGQVLAVDGGVMLRT
jgi:NAD(P)-dependent dehydrogenase (short-subunit alcohol dehydrogenase family)